MKMLESERVYLRRFNISDVDAIYSYRSLPEIAKYQYWHPYTKEDVVKFIDQNMNSDLSISDEWNGFAIINKQDETLIGDCAINIMESSAEIACNISPAYQKQGFAKETLQLLIDKCFSIHNLNNVYSIIDSNNIASINLMKSLGMKKILDFEETLICKGIPSTEHKYFIDKV